ncbi:MAG: transcriptional repressor [Actinomycetota bacterium]|nr:transcriptional repressor [Actinomycetota bacterium]
MSTTEPQRKTTRQRTAVSSWLEEQDKFHSAQNIHAELRDAGEPIGLATVYRTLQAMTDDGEVDVLHGDDGTSVYRRCSAGHHHHLVCRACGRTVEVQDRPVERWAAKVATEHGFSDVEHQVEVFGVCGRCASDS